MGRSAAGLITSRRAHEFGIESRTANGSVLSAPADQLVRARLDRNN